jgi:predicted double-glycine peptidase
MATKPVYQVACPLAIRLLAVAFALYQGAATAGERPVRSLQEMRQENLIIQQWDSSCAAAALATILTYDLRYPVTEEQVALGMLKQTDPLRVRHRGGFSLLDMKRYAAELNFRSSGYTEMTLDDLGARVPMIVPIKVRGYDHFVVVRNVTEREVRIADPGFGNYMMSRERFNNVWPGVGFKVGNHHD